LPDDFNPAKHDPAAVDWSAAVDMIDEAVKERRSNNILPGQ